MFPPIRKYPKEIVVNGNVWTIQFTRKSPDEHEDTLGLSDPGERKNSIRLGQSRRDIFKTFIHELIHSFEAEYDFRLPHGDKSTVFPQLEDALADFWLENPDIIFQLLLDTFGEG